MRNIRSITRQRIINGYVKRGPRLSVSYMQPWLSSKGLVISKRERRGRRREGKEREEGEREGRRERGESSGEDETDSDCTHFMIASGISI